jgi:hypothetical protein
MEKNPQCVERPIYMFSVLAVNGLKDAEFIDCFTITTPLSLRY